MVIWFVYYYRIVQYQECPCPTNSIEQNQVIPYPAPTSNIYAHQPGVYAPPVHGTNDASQPHLLGYHPIQQNQQNENGAVSGSHIAGIVSAVCSMIIMVVLVVVSFLKKYVYGAGAGSGNGNSNKGNGSVKSGDSLENNLLLMETMTGAVPNGKPLIRSNTFIV